MHALTFESTETLSQDDFANFVAERMRLGDGYRYELLNGRVVMTPPAADPHGRIENRVQRLIGNYAALKDLGEVFGSSQGFELPTGDTVEPDAAFVTAARWSSRQPPGASGFVRVVPDLAVEILSPNTRGRDVGEKKAIYEQSGVREYWLIDPRARTLTVFSLVDQRFDPGTQYAETDRVQCPVLPGLAFDVTELFPRD